MKVLLATGVPNLDTAIEKRINSMNFVGTALYKESVKDLLRRKETEHIVVSELLDGVMSFRELILSIRYHFPSVHIVSILKDKNQSTEIFLNETGVYDILIGSFTVDELEKTLMYPNTND